MRQIYSGQTKDQNGRVLQAATVSVFLAGTALAANIYTTLAGTTAVNSVTSSTTDGAFSFYVDRFDYDTDQAFDFSISKTNFSTITLSSVAITNTVLGTYTISADKTITTQLYPPKGVVYSVASGKTLTINGAFGAGMYQVFSGSGTVSFAALSTVPVEWFGADATGATDSSSALEAAIASLPATGGTITAGYGTFVFDDIKFPGDPKVINIQGAGINATIFKMGSAAGPMFHKEHAVSRITGAHFSDFTIKAHASSDRTNAAHMAWETAGWSNATWERIAYKSNGTGSVSSLFYLSNDTWNGTYNQTLNGLVSYSNVGPAHIVKTYGATSATNPNIVHINDAWIYSNTNMTTVFDMSDCTVYSILGSLIESNTGAKGISLGQAGKIDNNWFEGNLANNALVFQNTGTVTSSRNYIGESNYFSESQTITIPSDCNKNEIHSDQFTITDNGTYNFFVNAMAAPTQGEFMTLDTAPGGAGWSAGDTITGQTSAETAKIISVFTNKLYIIGSRTGMFTSGEILSNGVDTANQGAGYPTIQSSMALDVAPGGAGWAVSDTITGVTSGATAVILYKWSGTSYIVSRTGLEYTLGEVLTNGVATADQGATYPQFHPTPGYAPLMKRIGGATTGTLNYTTGGPTSTIDSYSREITYNMNYAWIPDDTNTAIFQLAGIDGYHLMSAIYGATKNSDGEPQLISAGWPLNQFAVKCSAAAATEYTISIKAAYKKQP